MADRSQDDSFSEGPARRHPPSGHMDVHGATHVGRRRPDNEDQFLIADLKKSLRVYQTSLGLDHQTRLFGGSQGKLLVVADGMGGHQAGSRASTIAVDSVATHVLNTMRWLFRLDEGGEDDFEGELKTALEHCQAMINSESEAIPQRKGMGTTLTMAYVIWPRMFVVHAGDSRCYLSRNSNLEQITRDHTVSQLYREKMETPAKGQAPQDPDLQGFGNMLWNVLGGETDDLLPEVYRARLELGDTLLLCSDGLTKHLSDQQIQQQLDHDDPAEQICQRLIDEANERGGSDNITVVVARFREQPPEVEVAEADTAMDLEQTDDFPQPVKSSFDLETVGHSD